MRKYQKEPTYELSKDYNCTHCGSHCDIYNGKNHRIPTETSPVTEYSTKDTVDWESKNSGYAWVEDMLCTECGKYYSRNNGC